MEDNNRVINKPLLRFQYFFQILFRKMLYSIFVATDLCSECSWFLLFFEIWLEFLFILEEI